MSTDAATAYSSKETPSAVEVKSKPTHKPTHLYPKKLKKLVSRVKAGKGLPKRMLQKLTENARLMAEE